MKLYMTLLVLLACVGLVLAQESSTAGEGVAPPAESSGLGEGSLGGESVSTHAHVYYYCW